MNITAEWVGAISGVIIIVGGGVGAYLHVVDRRQGQEIEDLKEAADKVHGAAEKRLDGLHNATEQNRRDENASRRDLERRLAQVEREHITRADHAEFRAEMLATVDKVGDRIGQSLDKLSTEIREDIRAMSKRVDNVEARG